MEDKKTYPQQYVLLRGLGRESGHWGSFLDKLQDGAKSVPVLAFDLPGTGKYFRKTSPRSISKIVDFMDETYRPQLEGKKTCLVAMSLGGMVAMEWLTRRPTEFAGAVLINSSFGNLSPIYKRLKLSASTHLAQTFFMKSIAEREKNILEMISNKPSVRQSALREWELIQTMRPVSKLSVLNQLFAASRYQLPKEKPTVPILCIVSENDRMVDPECTKALAKHWHLPLKTTEVAGHDAALDDPDFLSATILSF